ncbi:MAG: MDR family MFS transporter [Devosia sp.]
MSSDTIVSDIASESQVDVPVKANTGLVINILLVATFVVMLNETAMTVAIPQLMSALGVTAGAAQWLTTAFLLTMAVVIPVTGYLLQRFNTRPVFIAAMSLFSAGTLLATMAPNLEVLVLARVVQAAGTAIMMPLLMTTIMTLVPPDQRGKMMGRISIVMSAAPALGPVAAGLILQFLGWHWIFILVLPISLGALALGYRMIANVTTPRDAPLDLLSVVLSAVAFGGIAYGVSNLFVSGAPVPGNWALGVGAVTMVVFVWRQLILQRDGKALLDLRTLKAGNFTISVAMISILMLSMMGVMIVLPIYLVTVQGFNVMSTALLMLPGTLAMGFLGPFVGRLYDKVGPTPLIVPAMAVVTAVLWAMTMLGTTTPWPLIAVGHFVMSLGFAFLFGPLFTASLSSVQPQLYSHGSALLGSIQQLAGAAGVALFIAIMSARQAGLLALGEPELEALAGGMRLALTIGASVAILALIASFFVRKPAVQEGGWGGGH